MELLVLTRSSIQTNTARAGKERKQSPPIDGIVFGSGQLLFSPAVCNDIYIDPFMVQTNTYRSVTIITHYLNPNGVLISYTPR